jgi:hypothetical protein
VFPSLIFVGNIVFSHSLSHTRFSRCSTLFPLVVTDCALSLSYNVTFHCLTLYPHIVTQCILTSHCLTLYPLIVRRCIFCTVARCVLSSHHLILHPLIVTRCPLIVTHYIFTFFALYHIVFLHCILSF